jgi:hypothetical protein
LIGAGSSQHIPGQVISISIALLIATILLFPADDMCIVDIINIQKMYSGIIVKEIIEFPRANAKKKLLYSMDLLAFIIDHTSFI